LSQVPLYDDVAYFIDGIRRLTVFDQEGFVGVLRSFIEHPPHAPYSTILALLGFAVTPESMFGSYALNIIWLVVFLVLLRLLLPGVPLLAQLGILTASLSLPLLAIVIGTFRPDPYWGLITGAIAVLLATWEPTWARPSRLLLLGVLIGAAGLTKPTA